MLSPFTGYAAIALGFLSEHSDRAATVEEISRIMDIPAPYLGKIMHALARKGFVRTRRGVGGGVTLNCDPAKTTLLDLCAAFDDPIMERRCMLGVAECSDKRACPAHDFWTKHRERALEFAASSSVLSVGEFERRRLDQKKASKKTGAKGMCGPSSGAGRKSGGQGRG